MEISVDKLLQALPIMGYGMLGIFIVTAVIVSVVYLLNRIPGKKDWTIAPRRKRRGAYLFSKVLSFHAYLVAFFNIMSKAKKT